MKFTDKDLLKLDDFFKKYFKGLLLKLGFDNGSDEELEVLQEEVSKLFIATLYEAATEVLEAEEIYAIESELELSTELTEFDMYFAVAITKPNFTKLVNEKLTELTEQITRIYNKK